MTSVAAVIRVSPVDRVDEAVHGDRTRRRGDRQRPAAASAPVEMSPRAVSAIAPVPDSVAASEATFSAPLVARSDTSPLLVTIGLIDVEVAACRHRDCAALDTAAAVHRRVHVDVRAGDTSSAAPDDQVHDRLVDVDAPGGADADRTRVLVDERSRWRPIRLSDWIDSAPFVTSGPVCSVPPALTVIGALPANTALSCVRCSPSLRRESG